MNDSQLNGGVGIDGFNGLRKALQAIDAGNEDVLHTPVFKFRDDLLPELGTFRLGNPQAQHFLLTGQVESNRQIDGFDAHAAIPDFNVNAVQIDYGVDAVQWPPARLWPHQSRHR